MAKCPQCGQKIKPWYVKAECPNCGVNMVNYNWEERLEEDSVRAETAFRKLHINVAKMKYSFAGTKLRIARIPISVFPLFSFLNVPAKSQWHIGRQSIHTSFSGKYIP